MSFQSPLRTQLADSQGTKGAPCGKWPKSVSRPSLPPRSAGTIDIPWIWWIAPIGSVVALIFVFRATVIQWYEKAAIFLKEVRVEMQKVVWPSKQEVYGATFVVLVSIVILTVAIGIEDYLLSLVLKGILKVTTG